MNYEVGAATSGLDTIPARGKAPRHHRPGMNAKACSFLMRPDAALDTPDVSLHAEGWIDAFLKAGYVLIVTSLQTLKINRRRQNGRFAGALLRGLLCSFLGWGFSRGHCFSPGVSVSAIA